MAESWLGLENKICIVTGGTGGIGQSIVAELALAGAKVAILDRDQASVDSLAKSTANGTIGIACDVTLEASVESACARVLEAFGRCDVLVNNAGIIQPVPLLKSNLEDWRKGTAVNLDGYFVCARIFGAAMIDFGGGSIVHVGSIAAELPQPNGLGYSASKAGINALSRQIAIEWGPLGVRSNVVNPGMVLTPMTAKLNADPEMLAKRSALTANRRLGTPQDIANIVAFLASDRAGYINGADIMATGGTHVMMMQMIPQPGWKPEQPGKVQG